MLLKLKTELQYHPAIALLGIHLKKMKTLIQKDICIPMFVEVLFTIAKIQEQPKCPLMDEWIKISHTHTHICAHTHAVEYYLAIKR